MKLNIKLISLPFIVLIALVYSSFIFSSQMDKLKNQIDNIYFGNVVPIDNLHNIVNNYTKLLSNPRKSTKLKNNIKRSWEEYNSQFKTPKERLTIDKVNTLVIKSFKINKHHYYKFIITKIDLLIKHEKLSALLQRKEFLVSYDKMKNNLFYTQIFIISIILLSIIFVLVSILKNNKNQEYLIEKYKLDSITDGLTQLYNRKYFDTIFDDITIISSENNWTSSFVMIDIDFFKQYNDMYGHDNGDTALKEVSNAISSTFNSEYEYVFRLGGEEFGILIFNTNKVNLLQSLDKLQVNIKKLNIPHKASATSALTISMGVVLIDTNTYNSSSKELYKLADDKLYKSKDNGRNKYTL